MAARAPRLHVEVQPHHEQRRICASRAKYREGRRPRAVRVYTINLESRYLLVQGVPAIGVMKELVEQFALYGAIEEYNVLHEYPAEEFTDVYLIKFQRLQSARVAKRKQDERSFFGGILHVCYAPEYESVQETRGKLHDRGRYVAWATSSDKDHQVAYKRREVAECSRFIPVHSPMNFSPDSSYHTPVQSGDPPSPFCAPPPSVTSDYRQEDQPPLHFSGCDSRTKSNDNANHTGRTIGPAHGQPSMVSYTRFLPRTTQLQERQRRREERTGLSVLLPESQEIVIGPKLPKIPKLDMADESLNISAGLIRGKLKEVSATCTPTKPEPPKDPPTAPPIKQRRRI